MKTRILISTAAALAGVGLATAVGAPASAAPSHHLTDPVGTGCAANTSTIAKFAMTNDQSGMHITDLEVRYSPSCQTNWIRVNNPYPAGVVNVNTVIGLDGSRDLGMGSSSGTGYQWSQQVYAPGRKCVYVTATLADRGRIVAGGGPPIKVC